MRIQTILGVRAASAMVMAISAVAPSVATEPALPEYQPKREAAGVIRVCGDDHMGELLSKWEEGFKKYHPHIQFTNTLTGTGAAMYGLDMRTADIALMGRQVNPYERYGTYERSWIYPVEIEAATGSDTLKRHSPAFAVFVRQDNPLAKLTIKQLDGIFGAERGGGWKALSWDLSAARPASDNIRTWGQLGLKGWWQEKPIHVYGLPIQGPGAVSFFQARVLQGGAMWNEDLREYADQDKMIAALNSDPYGIAYAPAGSGRGGVKRLALAETADGPFVALTRESVASRSYPLSRPVYLYYTIDNEKSELADLRTSPKMDEFLHYILSRQGQADVILDGSYLPLPGTIAKEQLKKIESRESPPEHDVLED